ncbi:PAS domain-containing protein [Thalassobaculum sp.]|uniref:PAS domain-containing protein n=1 Tax=Thalassobaculum sp. TaxID=2022740 RepID=UPI0032ECA2F1
MTSHPSLETASEILRESRNPALRSLLEYWISIHPGDRLPARRHFDPLAVKQALPSLVLTDVERDPYRFKVRLMGTAVVSAMGKDLTGRYLDEAWPDAQDQPLIVDRIEVARSGQPSYRYGLTPTKFRLDFAPIERIYLPLAVDGERVDMILSMMIYLARDGGSGAAAEGA